MKAIGLISGTSVDGIDAAVVDIFDEKQNNNNISVDVLEFMTYPYPDGIRERILEVSLPGGGSVEKICHLNALIGELFAHSAIRIAEKAEVKLCDVEVIGSHGQTIHHLPCPYDEHGFSVTSTLQLGEPSIIAERTGVTTVADFRPRDMAAGGEGAPFAPYAHYRLFCHPLKTRIITNIGGISNLTYIPPGASPEQVIAFDTGPGNMIIDQLIVQMTHGTETYDSGGHRAASGKCHAGFLAWLMEHPYLKRQPPKSTGREEFGQEFVARLCEERTRQGVADTDLIRTVTEYTAETIVKSFQEFLPIFQQQWSSMNDTLDIVFCGGGVRNPVLMNLLQERLKPLPIAPVEKFHLSSDALEAVTFALLARETLLGKPSNLPTVTGAAHPVILGKIIPGNRFKGILQ